MISKISKFIKENVNINWLIVSLFIIINFHILRVLNIYFGLLVYLFYLLIFIINKNHDIYLFNKKIIKSPVLITFIVFGMYFMVINLTLLLDFDYQTNLLLLYFGKLNYTYPLVLFIIVYINKFRFFKESHFS